MKERSLSQSKKPMEFPLSGRLAWRLFRDGRCIDSRAEPRAAEVLAELGFLRGRHAAVQRYQGFSILGQSFTALAATGAAMS